MCSATMFLPGLDIYATDQRIGEYISRSGKTDKEIADILDLSVQSINKWRHGTSLPGIENMYLLSRILGCTVDDFLVPRAPIEEALADKLSAGASDIQHIFFVIKPEPNYKIITVIIFDPESCMAQVS